jgi:hypothetical protein
MVTGMRQSRTATAPNARKPRRRNFNRRFWQYRDRCKAVQHHSLQLVRLQPVTAQQNRGGHDRYQMAASGIFKNTITAANAKHTGDKMCHVTKTTPETITSWFGFSVIGS